MLCISNPQNRIGSVFQHFRHWLPAKPKAARTETPSLPLPEAVRSQLRQAIAALPTPNPYSETIREALGETIAAWRQQPEGNNVLVVLGSPIEPLGRIVEQALSDWPALDPRSLRMLRWSGIPTNPEAFVAGLRKDIREQLKGETEAPENVPLRFSADGVQLDAELRRQAAIVLPELTQCFVRCIEGLEGVLYLRKEILKDCDRFWIVGCNHWAWEYLSYVCQMNAYFDRTVALPALTGDDMFEWLAPVCQQLVELLPGVSVPCAAAKRDSFNGLGRVASGLSAVAAQMWLGSLRLSESTEFNQTQSQGSISTEGQEGARQRLMFSRAGPMKLSSLDAGDRHLLYSLLLHNGLQFRHLALSLGDEESWVQARVKGLQRQGLVVRRGRNLYVQPEFYPGLRSNLSGNNFLVSKAR